MNDLVEFVDGFYWPIKGGKSCRDYTLSRFDTPYKIAKYSDNKTIVHAGANIGFYASQFAEIFNHQYIFEPDFVNFYCLNLNVTKANSYKFQAFLGNKHGLYNLEQNSTDCGGHNLGKYPTAGYIPMLKIDDLELKECSLIVLDVEGYERNVIEGAMETINQYHPIISVEVAWGNCSDILNKLEYNKIDEANGDWIFEHN